MSPGERAYAAYVRVRYGLPEADAALTYMWSIPEERDAWEAAAQAVLAPRLAGQAAQLHHLIDYVVEHAPQAYLDKVHIWLTDLSGIVLEGNDNA